MIVIEDVVNIKKEVEVEEVGQYSPLGSGVGRFL